MKLFEDHEVTSGNSTGKAGTPSLAYNSNGYFPYGNTGSFGINFTPSNEPTINSYKKIKHKKKNKKKMLKYENFLLEDASVTMGNSNGMGAIVAAQPSSIPGSVADSIAGSGDIGQPLGNYTNSIFPKREKIMKFKKFKKNKKNKKK